MTRPTLADRILKRALAQAGVSLEEARRAFAARCEICGAPAVQRTYEVVESLPKPGALTKSHHRGAVHDRCATHPFPSYSKFRQRSA